MHSSSQSNCGSSFTCGVDTSVEGVLYVFEELGLGDTWVSEKKHVDVSSDLVLAFYIFRFSSKHGKRHCCLHVSVTID